MAEQRKQGRASCDGHKQRPGAVEGCKMLSDSHAHGRFPSMSDGGNEGWAHGVRRRRRGEEGEPEARRGRFDRSPNTSALTVRYCVQPAPAPLVCSDGDGRRNGRRCEPSSRPSAGLVHVGFRTRRNAQEAGRARESKVQPCGHGTNVFPERIKLSCSARKLGLEAAWRRSRGPCRGL